MSTSPSAGHEHGDRRFGNHGPCDTAQDPVAQARVPVCPEDKEVGGRVNDMSAQHVRCRPSLPRQPVDRHLGSVARKVGREVGPRLLAMTQQARLGSTTATVTWSADRSISRDSRTARAAS